MALPEPFSREMDRFFNDFLSPVNRLMHGWVPAMDLVEAGDHYVVKADLPGLTEQDVNVEVEGRTLTISGERKQEHEQTKQGWHRLERAYGRFSRSLALPEGTDPEAVSATFTNGVLEVSIPKPKQSTPHRVSISQAAERETVEGSASSS